MLQPMNLLNSDSRQELVLYHGSNRVRQVEDILFPGPRKDCDFGRGFYLTEQKQVAEEWVCFDDTPTINEYRVSIDPNAVLHLIGEAWLRVVLGCRTGRYSVVFKHPVIHGLIADDRMANVIPLFLSGTIGDKRLIECLDFCNLGNQYCILERIPGLTFVRSYALHGLELQRANERNVLRKRGMGSKLVEIQRRPVSGERFIEDYLAEGDYVEL